MARRDYYEVLGVLRHATSLEIRRAYRRLAREYSPDVNVGAERGAALFEEITEAYRVLSDSTARSVYDRLGRRIMAAEETADAARRGDDLHYPVELDLEDAIRGVTAILDVARRQKCPSCQGRPGTEAAGRERCAGCGGRGTLLGQARVPVDIPPGVDTGTEIRVPGEGHAAPGGGPPGDLVVITRLRPHPFFTRKGDHLSCEVPVTIPEAVLGARIRVPTPDGPAVVTIPPGTQSGQVFRVRGRGCPRLHREVRGDLLVATRVVIPRNADSTLEGVLRELERLLPENPRADLWRWEGAPR
jgi:molecular chaperone DnaJ